MAPNASLPASLLRTYTTLLNRQTSQLQLQASPALGLAPRSQPEDAFRQQFEGVTSRILGLSGAGRLQAIPVQAQSFGQRRWKSTDNAKFKFYKEYQFDDVLHILETPSDSRLLIDVREPHEYQANSIPTAINLPIKSQPDALLLSEEEFQDRFGFQKPPANKDIVFFCRAGVRSSAAASIARQAGYKNVGEYKGSFLDWEKRGGPGTTTPPKPEGMGEPKLPVTETKPVRGPGDSGEEDLGEQGAPPYPEGPMTPRQ